MPKKTLHRPHHKKSKVVPIDEDDMMMNDNSGSSDPYKGLAEWQNVASTTANRFRAREQAKVRAKVARGGFFSEVQRIFFFTDLDDEKMAREQSRKPAFSMMCG